MHKITIFLLFSSISVFAQICEDNDVEIKMDISESLFKRKSPRITEITLEKNKIVDFVKVLMVRASRSYRYCFAKIERAESTDCPEKHEHVKYTSEELMKMSERRQCLVGKTCNEYECKGDLSSICLENKLTDYIEPREMPSSTKATSLLRHTCIQKWACSIREVEVNLHLNVEGSIDISDPLYGDFTFPKSSKVSEGNSIGNYAILRSEIEQSVYRVLLPCLTESGATLCYDESEEKVFSISPKGKTCIGSACYSAVESMDNVVMEEEMMSLGKVPTTFDLLRLYRLMQYLNIQTMWDFSIIAKSQKQIERITRRLLMWASKQDENFPSYLIGRKTKTKYINDEKIKASVCRANFTIESEMISMFKEPNNPAALEQDKSSKEYSAKIFLDEKLENLEAPKPKFQIDSLTYNDIAHLEHGADGSKNSFESDKTSDNFWIKIFYFLEKVGCYCGLISILVLLFGCRR
nr:MAG: hypothetical protein 1 [Byreska virus]